MSARKLFHELSERQKTRRLSVEYEKFMSEMVEVDKEDIYLSKNKNLSDNNIYKNLELNTVEQVDDEDTELVDYITAEFRKFVFESEEANWFGDSADSLDISENEYSDTDDDGYNNALFTNFKASNEFQIKNRIGSWATLNNIPDIKMNSLLVILRDAGLTYLPKDVRSLRSTPKNTNIIPCPPGEYFHYGLQTAIEDIMLKYNYKIQDNIIIDINIDGLPISKSPQSSLWPILGRIVNETYNEVFIIGVYRGQTKPESPTIYLENFITEYNQLHDKGFTFNNRNFTVKIRCLICDSPAASFILAIKQFNGYYGCRKCIVKGDWKSRTVFLQEDEALRTNVSFRHRLQKEHHTGKSLFEELEFDMVGQVPLDYMHLVCLGVTKLLIRLWINPRTNPLLNIIQLQQISSNFVALIPWIPKEFARKPQALLDLKNWKATTFRLFLNYAGSIILQDILPKEYLEHFIVFHCAIRILCDSSYCLIYTDYAKQLLVYFVKQFKNLYGENLVTWNVHNLIHLADDSKALGTLDAFSAFPFENFMQTIKRMIRKNAQPLQQIHRRLREKRNFAKQKKRVNQHYPVMQQPTNKRLPKDCHSCHRSLKFKTFELKDVRPNNCCLTKANSILVIERICKRSNEDVVVAREFLEKDNIPNYPLPSTDMGICEVKNLSTKKIFLVNEIDSKACLFFHQGKSYVIPLLHHETKFGNQYYCTLYLN